MGLDRIRELVGPGGVIEGADRQRYLNDQRGLYQGASALVVRPATVEAVAQVVAVCNEVGLGVVPQGGHTGYCGGAVPFGAETEVVISLERLNAVRSVDPIGYTMTLEAGVVLANAQAAAAEHGRLLPLSMGSEGSCQIGGNLSTNAGGLAVVRYGTARELVLGLEVVLPNGEILSDLKQLRKDSTGYPLRQLFLGAEGTLGIITAAVMKLFPQPGATETAWFAAADVQSVVELFALARDFSADQLVSYEYVSGQSLQLVLEHVEGVRDPLDEAYEHYVLLEFAGPAQPGVLREALESVFEKGAERGWLVDGVIAESGPQADGLWRLRESIPEAEKLAGGGYKHDISLPISAIPEFVSRARPAMDAIGSHRLSVFGHIGDGNLHYNIITAGGANPDKLDDPAGNDFTRAIYDHVLQLGGSFSAEHGVGLFKKEELTAFKSPAALELMRGIKSAIDPRGIMNRGKLVG